MTKFVVIVLGLLGQNIVKGVMATEYTAADNNYTPSVAFESLKAALSQYGANFNHAFANPKQDSKQAILASPLGSLGFPLATSALVGSANALYTASGLSTVTTKVTANCNKLKSLVGIADPTVSYLACTASSCSPPTTARSSTSATYTSCAASVSSGTADCVATNLLDTYYLQGAIGSAASATVATSDGLAAITTVALGKTTHSNVALTVNDFNLFRKKVAQAINTLDKKIESILAITAPTC